MNNKSPAGFITLGNVRNCNDMIVSVCLRLDAITSYCYDKENKKTLVFMNGEIKPWGFDGDLTGAIDKAVNEWYLARNPKRLKTVTRYSACSSISGSCTRIRRQRKNQRKLVRTVGIASSTKISIQKQCSTSVDTGSSY